MIENGIDRPFIANSGDLTFFLRRRVASCALHGPRLRYRSTQALRAGYICCLAVRNAARSRHPGRRAQDPARPYLKLITSNVYRGNHRTRRIQDLVARESPDVVGLIEVTPHWTERLKSMHTRFPYRFELPDEDVIGLALYSRFPLENARPLPLSGEPWTPAIAATIKAPGGDFEFLLVHPVSPVGAEYIERRNRQILALAQYVAAARGPVVIAGDFNLTMWNSGYRPLVEVASLHNARKGYGVGRPQLKILQKVIMLAVFVHFSVFYMKASLGWDYLFASFWILLAIFFMFRGALAGAAA